MEHRDRQDGARASGPASEPGHGPLALEVADARAVIAVTEAGGFRAAALASGTDVAMVSRRVARLERRLGITLVHRSSRRVEASAAGVAALPALRDVVAAHDAAAAELRRVAGGVTGVLRVAVDRRLGSADRAAVRRFVDRLARRLPGWSIVAVRAFGPAGRRALGRGAVDLVVGRGYVGPGLRHAPVGLAPEGLRVAWAGGWRGPGAEAVAQAARGADGEPAGAVVGERPRAGRAEWGRPGSPEVEALRRGGRSSRGLRAAVGVPLLTESAAWPRSPT